MLQLSLLFKAADGFGITLFIQKRYENKCVDGFVLFGAYIILNPDLAEIVFKSL